MFSRSPQLYGAFCALLAVLCFSVNDVTVKFLSGGYALHELILIRALFGLVVLFGLILPFSGGIAALRTHRLGVHLLRGGCVVFANITFFLGLAAMPFAEGVAVFFVSPLIITVFSVIFLAERVGPRRWIAVVVGLCGVIVVLRPGSETFQLAALLPLAAAFGYATLNILTRIIGKTESAAAMTFYIQITFILVTISSGLAFGDGKYAHFDHPSLDFLLRPWVRPDPADLMLFVALGLASSFGGYFISQAYRISEAALVAPIEYVAMPLAIVWGITIFGEWPDAIAGAGIAMIIGAGLFMVWAENQAGDAQVPDTPRYRR